VFVDMRVCSPHGIRLIRRPQARPATCRNSPSFCFPYGRKRDPQAPVGGATKSQVSRTALARFGLRVVRRAALRFHSSVALARPTTYPEALRSHHANELGPILLVQPVRFIESPATGFGGHARAPELDEAPTSSRELFSVRNVPSNPVLHSASCPKSISRPKAGRNNHTVLYKRLEPSDLAERWLGHPGR